MNPSASFNQVSEDLDAVCRRDKKLAAIRKRLGEPPAFRRPATFATMIRIILEQQISLASGKATFERLRSACGGVVNSKRIRQLETEQIANCGVTRQKTRYVIALADAIAERRFSVTSLAAMTDEKARASIISQIGMGQWTADVYLMMALGRPDIFPIGDLALVKGIEHLDQTNYTRDEIIQRGEDWRPFRSSATRLIWADYLHRKQAKRQ